jgi:putative membrane protein
VSVTYPGEGSADKPRTTDFDGPTVRDHLANERTLLAWIRTALTVVGLGFIVDRLALTNAVGRFEALAGLALVLLGGAIAVAGGWSFLRARRELTSGTYRPSGGIHLALVGAVVLGALLVALFLLID